MLRSWVAVPTCVIYCVLLSCSSLVVDGFATSSLALRTTAPPFHERLPHTTLSPRRSSMMLQEKKDSSIAETSPSEKEDEDRPFFTFSLFQRYPLPPPDVEDFSVLLFDILLLLNLTVSVSFWVTHRWSLAFLGVAVSEGCLLSTCWIGAGLLSGSFLYSAANGHNGGGGSSETATDVAVGTLALNTFVNAVNVRLLFALILAVLQHRPVGTGSGEDLLGVELGFGVVLMPVWRILHGRYVTGRMM